MLRLALAVVLAALPLGTAAAQPELAPGRELTETFYAGRTGEIWERMAPVMRNALGSPDALAAFRARVEAGLGTETAVEAEAVTPMGGTRVYRRRARFTRAPGLVLVEWVVTADGQVAGFRIAPDQQAPQPPAPSEHLERRTRADLRLPFDGEFFVVWGGRTVEQNYHAAHPSQRFAYDLLVVRDGATHTGDGRRNEQYHCFGQPILAPADGRVVLAVDGIADNVPGQMNAPQVAGNQVVVDHGTGEFSLLAHLRSGSVAVRPGDRVTRGQRLGECGNSGNSSEPHLHYQLQDGPELGASAALPAQFTDYLADGGPVARGEPVRGQSIRPAPAAGTEDPR
ncbi:MAG: Peptidase, M23/M37 family [uncultured Gemmatimonadetes bacterium]|uniref:Peptidase, M23/M37 family n=1 Tax=uncultured Gemmatimonadota bacterium TaxID=203437 RepID=A0A6J4MSI0_9BACT|nr:MAG: Peptidase, M23/M37 family [uncultured Gemmatimonadota bacterium]